MPRRLDRILIRTKLTRPRAGSQSVSRPRLLQRLDEARDHRVTLISAPPGFGKSTLVAQWLDQQSHPCAWVALDACDNAPEQFAAYLVAAIEGATPHRLPGTSALLAARTPPPFSYLTEVLISELARIDTPMLLVLDDFHAVPSSDVQNLVERLVPAMAPPMRLVVLTRVDPPWPLANWRARGWLLEVRTRELRFSLEEARAFFAAGTCPPLSDDAIKMVHKRAEGWVTALRLVDLSLRDAPDPEERVRAFSGTDRLVADYLVAEVAAVQSTQIREFLAVTALLPRFCADLAAFLLAERRAGAPARDTLARLDRENLFLVPLDGEGHWYRYHHLFQELLQHHLKELASPEHRATIRRRAAEWFADEGLIEEALRQWIAAGEIDAAAHLVGEHFRSIIDEDPSRRRLASWLALFPAGAERGRLPLLVAHGYLKVVNWDLPGLSALLDEADTLQRGANGQSALERGDDFRADLDAQRAFLVYWRGDAEGAAALASRALDGLPARGGGVTWTLGCFYKAGGLVLSGRRDEGLGVLEDAVAKAGASQPSRVGEFLFALGALHLYGDDLASAELMARRAMAAHETAPMPEYWLGHVLYLQAAVAYERNLLDEATTQFSRIVAMRYRTSARIYQDALVGLCLIARARGDDDEGRRHARDARAFALDVGDPTSLCIADWLDTRLALWRENGTLPALRPPAIQDASFFWLELPSLTYAEALVHRASADAREAALPFIDQALARVNALHNTRQAVPLALVRALALAERGDRSAALVELAMAVDQAESLGLVRSILDRGPRVMALLEDLANQRGRGEYLDRLLSAGEQGATPPGAVRALSAGGPAPPVDDLTNREMDVLELLARRLSNKEIADRLGVSPHTVKRHTADIYEKLQVHGRRQAVSRAASAGLIRLDP